MFEKLKNNYFVLIITFLFIYFAFNLLDGERGLISYMEKKDIYEQLKDKSIEAIFHVAGINKKCQKDSSSMFRTNIEGTKQMLELGNRLNIEKFVYTSSATTLGEQKGTIGTVSYTHLTLPTTLQV